MAGLNIALEAGRRALFSQQTAVNVIGSLISGVACRLHGKGLYCLP
jgi:hypothetical protein